MPSYTSLRRNRNDEERLRIISKLLALRAQLDEQVPAKTATDTLLLATWNVREFGDNRRTESLHYLAEIVNRFDLVALQEVSSDLSGLQKLVSLLGHNWDYIVTDSTEGKAGGGERMAFIFDRCKVFFRKMAGEVVLPDNMLVLKDKQFARTPFCVAFQAGWFRFILATVHIYYGSSDKNNLQRVDEIAKIADFFKKRAKKDDESYIILGDFNIFNVGDLTFKALEDRGFYVPYAIREHPSDLRKTKHYDQMAFKLKLETNMTVFSEGEQHSGAFDFTETIYTADDLETYRPYFDDKYVVGKTEKQIENYYLTKWRTFEISDHLPLWIELKVDFSDQYLEKIKTR
ncbi:MAG: endonuclease/exonuclease/phosphatase family protein [Coriobacteriia bacterium]|nr:endonuclease/exonuclease/phosphatase family protein [Coriobacteriia bacterium]